MVNINTGRLDELRTISGVGEVLGRAIVRGRLYDTVDDLKRVSGIDAHVVENNDLTAAFARPTVVISGGRCGSSLCMYLLKKMGAPVLGEEFPAGRKEELNPDGFWEDNRVLMSPLLPFKLDIVDGKVFKQAYRAFFLSDEKFYERVVVCIRHPLASVLSKARITGDQARCETLHLHRMRALSDGLKSLSLPTLIVGYDDVIKSPEKSVGALDDFMGIRGVNVEAVASRVDPGLRHFDIADGEWVNIEAGREMESIYAEVIS